MIATLLAKLMPYKLAILAAALVATHGAVFWKTWSWRDDVHDSEMAQARAEFESAKGKVEKEASDARETITLDRELFQRQLERAKGELDSINARLAAVPRCPAPRAVVERIFLHAGPPVRSSPGDATVAGRDASTSIDPVRGDKQDGTIDLRDVAWNYAVNVREVIEPNRADLEQCMALYNNEREKYRKLNRAID